MMFEQYSRLPKTWRPPYAHARPKTFALESTPLPCAPPMIHVSSLRVIHPPPVATPRPIAQSQSSISPQYGHRHWQSSIGRPQLSHSSTPSVRGELMRNPLHYPGRL